MDESTVESGSDELPHVDAGPGSNPVAEDKARTIHEPGKDAGGSTPGDGAGATGDQLAQQPSESVTAKERMESKPPQLTEEDARIVEKMNMIEGSEAHAEGGIPKMRIASSEGDTTDGVENGGTDATGPSEDTTFETPMDPGFLPNLNEFVTPGPPETPDERAAKDPAAWKMQIDRMVEEGLMYISSDAEGHPVATPMTIDGCKFAWLNEYVGLVEVRANHEEMAVTLCGELIGDGWTMIGLDGGMIMLEAPQAEEDETAQRPPTPIDRLGQGSTPFFNS